MTTKKYIKDYPRPQFVRDNWVDLNGEWRFGFDDTRTGEAEGWQRSFGETAALSFPSHTRRRLAASGRKLIIRASGTIDSWIFQQRLKASASSCIFKRSII